MKTSGNRKVITQDVTRGARRLLTQIGYSLVTELTLKNGRRVDLIGVNDKGKLVIVEVKSCFEDFNVDEKWREYLPFCDTFYFAVDANFPIENLPDDTGLIIADSYGAEIIHAAAEGDLNPARRKAIMLRFARLAAQKSMRVEDPDFSTKS